MIRRFLLGLGALILIAITGLGFYTWTPSGPLLDEDEILQTADRYNARIIRDAYGVPHIYGKRDGDVAYGLGYAHAEDDFETIQLVLALSRGTLARYKGIDAARTDYLVKMFRIWPQIRERYESALSPEMKAVLEGYVAGINLYALENEEERWKGLFPVTAQDVVAGFVFRAPFFFGLERDLAELFAEERKRHISMRDTQTAFQWTDTPNVPRGSNAVVVAPSRTADGSTRLLVNSHQPLNGPVAWYEVRLKSEEGWDALGALFPGAPIMLHGHTDKLGWAHTVNKPDLVDIYALEVDPDNPRRYRFDGGWREFERAQAEFRVKLFGPFSWPVKRPVLWSVHGPVLESNHGTYAIAHAGQGSISQVEQWYQMNKAQNLSEWLDAMEINALPSLNTLYADQSGNIAFIYNMRVPDRVEGYDWRAYLPGEDKEALWQGIKGFEAVPKQVNPPSGVLFNANHTPFAATGGDDELKPEAFPETLGVETHFTNRGRRALALWGKDQSITAEEFEAYKFDVTYDEQSRVMGVVSDIVSYDLSGQPELEAAQQVLRDWDQTASQESKGAALAILSSYNAHWEVRDALEDAPDPVDAFKAAVQELNTHFGRVDVTWGDINRIKRGRVDLPVDGGPDTLRAIYSGETLDDDGQLNAIAGDSYIMIVEWDKNGRLRSRTVHNYGSATLDETSPHYADQVKLFAKKGWKQPSLSLENVLKEATRDYRPGR